MQTESYQVFLAQNSIRLLLQSSVKKVLACLAPWIFYLPLVITFNILTTCLLDILLSCCPKYSSHLVPFLHAVTCRRYFQVSKTLRKHYGSLRKELFWNCSYCSSFRIFFRIAYSLENVSFISLEKLFKVISPIHLNYIDTQKKQLS